VVAMGLCRGVSVAVLSLGEGCMRAHAWQQHTRQVRHKAGAWIQGSSKGDEKAPQKLATSPGSTLPLRSLFCWSCGMGKMREWWRFWTMTKVIGGASAAQQEGRSRKTIQRSSSFAMPAAGTIAMTRTQRLWARWNAKGRRSVAGVASQDVRADPLSLLTHTLRRGPPSRRMPHAQRCTRSAVAWSSRPA
jgi:hypothetical protein